MRHVDAHFLGSLNNHAALGRLHFDAVNGVFYHEIVLSLQILGHHTLLVLNVVCELVAEMLDKTTHGERSSIIQTANRTTDDVICDLIQNIDILHATLTVLYLMHHAQ